MHSVVAALVGDEKLFVPFEGNVPNVVVHLQWNGDRNARMRIPNANGFIPTPGDHPIVVFTEADPLHLMFVAQNDVKRFAFTIPEPCGVVFTARGNHFAGMRAPGD